MGKHKLSLDIPDTLNTCVLRIQDTSTYDPTMTPGSLTLQVLAPGYTNAGNYYPVSINFSLNLTACDLGLQLTNCSTVRNSIPDGVYAIKYSVAPNTDVYVEYNHLRISAALDKINSILCCLDVPNCEPVKPIKDKLQELNLLTMMLKAAKARVEYCHNPKQGMDMYTYVMNKLTKLSCSCGCETC